MVKFTIIIVKTLVAPTAVAYLDLFLRGQFAEQKLILSSSFRCDQIHNYQSYDFGPFLVPLKLDLDVQQTHLSARKEVAKFRCVVISAKHFLSEMTLVQHHSCE